jgi:hypothetical protein
MTVVVLLQLLNSNANAVTVNKPFFSVNVPDNWVYANAVLEDADGVSGVSDSGVLLIPTESSDFLINNNGNLQEYFQNLSAYSFMTIDEDYPFRNVPLEIYTQNRFNESDDKKWQKENATIDGERALKINATIADNRTNTDQLVGYYVIHDGIPYRLEYYATVKDFLKYLPQFEQMVKTFKFTK